MAKSEDELLSRVVAGEKNSIHPIDKAICECKEGEIVFISGRGNRRVLCNGENTMKLLKDSDVVKKVLEQFK